MNMIMLATILVAVAIILFVLAAVGVASRFNLMALGLAFWAAAYLVIIAGR